MSETFTSEVDPSLSAGPSPRRGRWLAIGSVLGVAVTVAVAAVLWLVFRDGDDEPTPVVDRTAAAVEVFDPSPARARAIVSSGTVRAVG